MSVRPALMSSAIATASALLRVVCYCAYVPAALAKVAGGDLTDHHCHLSSFSIFKIIISFKFE